MIRRMKIKASPNLAGGVKRGGIPGKKLPQLSSQVKDTEEPSSQIGKKESILESIDENNTIKEPQTILNENKIDEYHNAPIKEMGKDHENETAPQIDIPSDKNCAVDTSSIEGKIISPTRDKSGHKNINASQTDYSHCKESITSISNDSEHQEDLQVLNSQEDKPGKEKPVNTNTSLSHSFMNEAPLGGHTNTEISNAFSPPQSCTFSQDSVQNISNATSGHDIIDIATNEPGLVNSEVTSLDANEKKNISARSVVTNSTAPKLITQTLRNKITTNLQLVNKISGRRAKIKGCPAINKRQPRHPINSSKNNATNTVQHENKVTVLESRDTMQHENKGTVLESRNDNDSKKLKDQEIKSLKEKSQDSLTTSVVNTRESAESKENIDESCLKKTTSNKLSQKQPNANKSLYIKKSKDPALHSFIKSDEIMKEKKMFYERKLKFRKKISTGQLEKKQMTMFDLIFWNPDSNPMPGRDDDDDPRIGNSSFGEIDITSEIIEEGRAEEEGLQTGHTKTMEQPETSEIEEEETATLAPQVKIGPNGDIILDEQSLIIQTTAAKNRDEILSRTEVVEEPTESSHYGRWSKKRRRSTEWTRKETARFYKALSTVGTDFSLMETIFAWRSRSELKVKFKKEEKFNRNLIDTALNDCTQFDFTIFDESDYDPEEDRKESKETEKAEAKKKKELEREQKKLEKANEKKRKKEQLKIEKLRKKKLKSLYKKQKRKKVAKVSVPQRHSASSAKFTPQEVICEVVFSNSEGDVKEHNHTQNESQNNAATLPETSIPSNSICIDTNAFINLDTQDQNEGFPISGYSGVVELGSDEGIIISQKSIPGTEGDTSSSCFNMKNSVPLSSEMSIPESESVLISASTVAQDGSKGDLDLVAVPGIPVSIYPELHSTMCETVDSSENSVSMVKAKIDEGSQVTGEKHFKQTPQPTEQGSSISQFCIPVEHVQTSPSTGHRFVEIETAKGIKKIAVPVIGPQTSHIVVLETPDPENPSEKIYHFYMVAPTHTSDSSESVSDQPLDIGNS